MTCEAIHILVKSITHTEDIQMVMFAISELPPKGFHMVYSRVVSDLVAHPMNVYGGMPFT